jgi:hypothetical protein
MFRAFPNPNWHLSSPISSSRNSINFMVSRLMMILMTFCTFSHVMFRKISPCLDRRAPYNFVAFCGGRRCVKMDLDFHVVCYWPRVHIHRWDSKLQITKLTTYAKDDTSCSYSRCSAHNFEVVSVFGSNSPRHNHPGLNLQYFHVFESFGGKSAFQVSTAFPCDLLTLDS